MDKQRNLDQLFALAKEDQVMQSFEETKDRFKASLKNPAVNTRKTKQVFTKKWIIMFTTVSTISLSVILLWNTGESRHEKQAKKAKTDQIAPQKTSIPIQPDPEQKTPTNATQQSAPFLSVIRELVTELPFSSEINTEKVPEKTDNRHITIFNPLDEQPYQFPMLTEEEIAITKKKKKAMLKALAKHDKNAYVYVPGGTFDYNGNSVSVQAFYMGTTEVTNFEYRTFLFDLLIQGRKDEFLKAKPDQSKWNTYPMYNLRYFQENYFSDKKYNDYCVVNISREGAELYCLWLSQELRKYVGDGKEASYNDVRLPLRVEWVKAASNEGKQLPYPWNGPYIRHSSGAFQGNFVWGKTDSISSRAYNMDTTTIHDILAPAKSYWPNALGLYNMSGNAAEMVYESMDRSEPGTAGGSWRNWPEEVKIYATDPFKGVTDPKPTIGFRVVSTKLILNIKKIEPGN